MLETLAETTLATGNRPSAPTIVFLHGWTMDASIFDDQVSRLAGDFACHAIDLAGHGEKARVQSSTIDAIADDVAEELRRISGPVVIVGWSLGGMVAWNLLRRCPDIATAVAGLVVVDMSPFIVDAPDWPLGIKGFDAKRNGKAVRAMAKDWPAYAQRINAGMYARSDAGLHPATLERIRRNDPATMIAIWQALATADERETIARLACPMLVIHGSESRLYRPETAQWLVGNAAAATSVAFEASGHSPHLEEPERFAATVGRFARECILPVAQG